MAITTLARVPYTWRGGPALGADSDGIATFLRTELPNIQRAIPVANTTPVQVADYTVQPSDDVVLMNSAGGGVTATLPNPAIVGNATLTVKNVATSGLNTVTVGATVDGVSNPTLANGKAMMVRSNGTAWYQIGAV